MNQLVLQSTIASKMSQIETEPQYKELRVAIYLSARVAQAAFCIGAIYSGVAAFGALASGAVFLQAGVTAALEVFKACVCYDLTQSSGTLASVLEKRVSNSDDAFGSLLSSAFQGLGMNRTDLNSATDIVGKISGLGDTLGERMAKKITEGTLVLHHANPYIAKVLNQPI